MTALSVLGLLPPQIHVQSGSIRLGGTDLLQSGDRELNRIRGGRMGMLYQQPKRMFNPRKTIGNHLAEPLKLHRGLRGRQSREQALDLLADAGFEDPAWCARAYPHQLSGGMAQRAMLALAMAGQPELLLADEPTSALDKVLERQILELIDSQRRQHGLGVLYITHDLATVSAFADRVVVMEAGRVQESGPVRTVLDTPRTACTKDLLAASALTAARVPAAQAPAEGSPVRIPVQSLLRTPTAGRPTAGMPLRIPVRVAGHTPVARTPLRTTVRIPVRRPPASEAPARAQSWRWTMSPSGSAPTGVAPGRPWRECRSACGRARFLASWASPAPGRAPWRGCSSGWRPRTAAASPGHFPRGSAAPVTTERRCSSSSRSRTMPSTRA